MFLHNKIQMKHINITVIHVKYGNKYTKKAGEDKYFGKWKKQKFGSLGVKIFCTQIFFCLLIC